MPNKINQVADQPGHHLHGLIGANLLFSAIKLNASKISRFSALSVGYYLVANWISYDMAGL